MVFSMTKRGTIREGSKCVARHKLKACWIVFHTENSYHGVLPGTPHQAQASMECVGCTHHQSQTLLKRNVKPSNKHSMPGFHARRQHVLRNHSITCELHLCQICFTLIAQQIAILQLQLPLQFQLQ